MADKRESCSRVLVDDEYVTSRQELTMQQETYKILRILCSFTDDETAQLAESGTDECTINQSKSLGS